MDCTTKFIKDGKLKKGLKNDTRITELETKLSKKVGKKKKAYYFGKIDRDFGPYLYKAVRSYQKDNGLVVDGIVGPITLNHLGLCDKNVVKKPVRPQIEIRKKELLSYVFKQPNSYTCGPASACMCLSVKDLVTPKTFMFNLNKISKEAYTSSNNGTGPKELDNALNKLYNVKVEMEEYKNIETIAKNIDKNKPMIIHGATIPELGYKGSYGHYCIVTGYDIDNNLVKFVDPSRTQYGARWISISILKKFIDKRGYSTPIHSIEFL